jgi:hypothetical protein
MGKSVLFPVIDPSQGAPLLARGMKWLSFSALAATFPLWLLRMHPPPLAPFSLFRLPPTDLHSPIISVACCS